MGGGGGGGGGDVRVCDVELDILTKKGISMHNTVLTGL